MTAARLVTATLRLALVAHAALASLLLWWTPKGFGLADAKLWTHAAFPTVVAVACLAGALAAGGRWLARLGLGLAGLWLGAAAIAGTIFRSSAGLLVVVLVPLGLALVGLSWRSELGGRRRAAALALGVLIGVLAMLGQRAPAPSTRPVSPAVASTLDVAADLESEHVDVTCGRLRVRVAPRLSFFSCADDGFWALFVGPECPTLQPGALRVSERGGATVIDCTSALEAPVFSHLNRFTTLSFDRADVRLQLGTAKPHAFTSGGSNPPLRFVWLDAAGIAHLDQAAHDEKGPFTELARAALEGGVLSFLLWDDVGPACRVSFDTFASQASTEPSPTAGWGVAQNSLELFADPARSEAAILVGLAATSVGEGWDTVGHAAGTYRNVLRLEPVEPSRSP